MHSEDKANHATAVSEFEKIVAEMTASGDKECASYKLELKKARSHKNVIDTYGRFPYRNEIMGRTSTEEELQFLRSHNIL